MESPPNDDRWHVQLGSGQVCMMTLDLLDDAFQDGLIHEGTLVCREGTREWKTLAEVAGLVDDAQPGVGTPSVAPPPSFAPAPYSAGPLSTAPVAADIGEMDFDLEAPSFRSPKRSRWGWVTAATFVAVAALGFAKRGTLMNVMHGVPAATQAFAPVWENQGPSPAVGALVAAPLPAAAPAPTPTIAAPADTPAPESKFTEEQRRALEEADKKVAQKQKQKQTELQNRQPDRPRARVKSENPFHKGGNKYDPLNSSL
jgi:hypothetical protein